MVDGGPCLEDFDLLEPLQLGGASRCWRVRGSDDSRHVLCETRQVSNAYGAAVWQVCVRTHVMNSVHRPLAKLYKFPEYRGSLQRM